MQYAEVADTNLFKVTQNGWTDVGNYKVELTLKDQTNYIWSNLDIGTTELDFEITLMLQYKCQ